MWRRDDASRTELSRVGPIALTRTSFVAAALCSPAPTLATSGATFAPLSAGRYFAWAKWEASAVAPSPANHGKLPPPRLPLTIGLWSHLSVARPPSLAFREAFTRAGAALPWVRAPEPLGGGGSEHGRSPASRPHVTAAKRSRSGWSPRSPTARAKRGSAEGRSEARIGGRGHQLK
jgi:hypothetical protein